MTPALAHGQWVPVRWHPVIYDHTIWTFSARIHGAQPGDILGAELFVNGVAYPVDADATSIRFIVGEADAAAIPTGATASLYLDTSKGRVCWLQGTVTRGGT